MDVAAPVVLSVKFIDEDVLPKSLLACNCATCTWSTASRYLKSICFQPRRQTRRQHRPLCLTPTTATRSSAARALLIAIALLGFALATIVYRHMRRTAATTRRRVAAAHLALHDPLCGLPTASISANGWKPRSRRYARVARRRPFSMSISTISRTSTTRRPSVGDELIRRYAAPDPYAS